MDFPDDIPETAKRQALAAVLGDTHFDGSDRLRSFLTYVVEEELAGRGGDIRGKTIAQDVYDRDTTEGVDPENVVRVDARRLRQLLELYYEGAGKGDPVRLHIDTGGYRPRFQEVKTASGPLRAANQKRQWIPFAAFSAGAIVGALIAASFLPSKPAEELNTQSADAAQNTPELLRHAAIYEKSPAALQAFNLARQARAMIFPIFDRPRQVLVLSVFERVIEMDSTFFGGYAGAAQALATLSILSPDPQDKENFATAAMEFADEAVRLAPDQAWSQSAKSWAYLANGNYDEALTLGRRASQLDPRDGAVLDFFGAVAPLANLKQRLRRRIVSLCWRPAIRDLPIATYPGLRIFTWASTRQRLSGLKKQSSWVILSARHPWPMRRLHWPRWDARKKRARNWQSWNRRGLKRPWIQC